MTSETVVVSQKDQQLHLGKKVQVTWTRNGICFRGRGQIVALRPRQATVELLHQVGNRGEYAAGDLVQVPRYSDHLRWTASRGIQEIPADRFTHKDFL